MQICFQHIESRLVHMTGAGGCICLRWGEFLSFIDAAGAREYFEAVISVPQISAQKSRDLPCYQSILLFDYIINDFIQRTNTQERARYYPVLIWWKISSVIPLRPGEVYQLPKDCIHEKNGKYYIHIERVKNKYKRKQYSSPSVKDFEIREDVYSIISNYIEYTNQFLMRMKPNICFLSRR